MIELLKASVSTVNLPFTILLGIVLLYWIGVIFGALDVDFLEGDILPDMDLEASDGFLSSFLHLLSFGEVPVMVVASLLALSLWFFSVLGNYYFNPGLASYKTAFWLLLPNLVISFVTVSVILAPARKIFGKIRKEELEDQKVMYREGKVISGEVNAQYGQVEITTKGAPIVVNARISDGLPIKKGESVLVYEEDKDKGIFFVEKYNG